MLNNLVTKMCYVNRLFSLCTFSAHRLLHRLAPLAVAAFKPFLTGISLLKMFRSFWCGNRIPIPNRICICFGSRVGQ